MIRESMALPTAELPFASVPAVGRARIGSPAVMKPFAGLNEDKLYSDQINPFNVLVSCHVARFGHPTGADLNRFHLIAPQQPDPRLWLKMAWFHQYSGNTFRISTRGQHGCRGVARVKAYGDVRDEYRHHPESKCADATGATCGKQTTGLLQRRHVQIDGIRYIGKESNRLEEVEEGSIQSPDEVDTEYPDPKRDEWQTKIVPALRKIPLAKLVKATGMSRRALMDLRAGRSRPHPENQKRLAEGVKRLSRDFGFEIRIF